MNGEKKNKIGKSLLFWGLGIASSFVPVVGEYPIALAFFAAAIHIGAYRLAVSLIFFCCVLIRGTSLLAVKYVMIGISFLVLYAVAYRRKRALNFVSNGLLMGSLFVIFAMSGTGFMEVEKGRIAYLILEGLFIATLTMIFEKLGESGKRDTGEKDLSQKEEFLMDPGRQQLKEGAQALKKLSKTFCNMEKFEENLSDEEQARMLKQLEHGVCRGCRRARECWVIHNYHTSQATQELLSANLGTVWEGADGFQSESMAATLEEPQFLRNCIRKEAYLQAVYDMQEKVKLMLYWRNRLAESRLAIAGQLSEMSEFLTDLSKDIYDRKMIEQDLKEKIIRDLERRKYEVLEFYGSYQDEDILELLLYLRTGRKEAISVRKIEKDISEIYGKKMIALRDGRRIVGAKSVVLKLREEVAFRFIHGVARAAKNREGVSGDNFTVVQSEDGQLLFGLSDGMGSGIQAGKDSEAVMELVERFFEAGFHKKTMISLINATCMSGDEPIGATVDLCSVNLYEGTFEFLKQGAASSFLLENGRVRTLRGASMPIGLYNEDTFTLGNGKIGEEAYYVMVSDGIIDAFWMEDGEGVIEDILLEEDWKNPKNLANRILEEALIASNERPRDDMTVLVVGLWR